MKQLISIIFLILLVGCSHSKLETELEKSNEVEIKTMVNNIEKSNVIKDEKKMKELRSIIVKGEEIDAPKRAIGVKMEVANNTIMINFRGTSNIFFYIGEGYLFSSKSGRYLQVDENISHLLEF